MLEGTTIYVTVAYALTGAVLLGYWIRLGLTRRRVERALADAGRNTP